MRPLTPGKLTQARIALFPFAHQFRVGSRIRLTIEAPGGDRPEWAFDTPATGGQVTDHVAHDARHVSRIVLPVLPSGPDLGADRGAVPVAAGPAVPVLRRARSTLMRHLLDSAAVSKAEKRERQKENRERAREERERLQRRDKQMKTFRSLLIVLVPIMVILVIFTLASNGGDDGKAKAKTDSSITRSYSSPPPMTIDPNATYTATMDTSEGTITLALDAKTAPVATNNFVFLARNGFYDGLTFHRASKDFVIQGGDPKGDGSGGPGYTVTGEVPTDHYPVGALAAAKTGSDPAGTFGSQFFIVTGRERRDAAERLRPLRLGHQRASTSRRRSRRSRPRAATARRPRRSRSRRSTITAGGKTLAADAPWRPRRPPRRRRPAPPDRLRQVDAARRPPRTASDRRRRRS